MGVRSCPSLHEKRNPGGVRSLSSLSEMRETSGSGKGGVEDCCACSAALAEWERVMGGIRVTSKRRECYTVKILFCEGNLESRKVLGTFQQDIRAH